MEIIYRQGYTDAVNFLRKEGIQLNLIIIFRACDNDISFMWLQCLNMQLHSVIKEVPSTFNLMIMSFLSFLRYLVS